MIKLIRLLLLLALAAVFAHTSPAHAEGTLMVLEQTSAGTATHAALDTTLYGDDPDPIAAFVELNTPTDPQTAQVVWATHASPLTWQRDGSNNFFEFIKHAKLPEGAKIQYRIIVHQFNVEFGNHRHDRTAADPDWEMNLDVWDQLAASEYRVQAHIIIPGRPTQVLSQRVNVTPAQMNNPDPDPDPDPKPDPDPDPLPDPDPEEPISDPVPPTVGFTELSPSGDTRIIYVSDTDGDDDNDGQTPQTAVKTLETAVGLLRVGKPDWLLLKAGDTWDGQAFTDISVGGSSDHKPMVISSYGNGPRPLIIPPHNTHGLNTKSEEINGLVIKGLHFYGATRDPESGRYAGRPGDIDGINVRISSSNRNYIKGLIIEDCVVTHFDTNIKIVDDWSRLQLDENGESIPGIPGRIQCVVRRNIVRFASGDDSHSVGLYIEGTRDSIIEQNLLDHNGWTPSDGVEKRNKRSHNIYAQSFNGPIIVRHNIIARGAAHGLQLRAGGDIQSNLFVRNALAFFTSFHDSKANYNVILESDDMDPDVPEDWRGMGIQCWDLGRCEAIGNILARRVGTLTRPALELNADTLIVKNNLIYDWKDPHDNHSMELFSPNLIASGNVSEENYNGQEPPFVDPQRGVEEYAQSLGLPASLEAFLDTASIRPAGVWLDAFSSSGINGFIREGFALEEE